MESIVELVEPETDVWELDTPHRLAGRNFFRQELEDPLWPVDFFHTRKHALLWVQEIDV